MKLKYNFLLVFWLIFANQIAVAQIKQTKPRVVITADPELDDYNSMIRFLLYSNDFELEGLMYASSGFHWKGNGKGKKWEQPNREYKRFGLNLCPCTSWRWAPNERFINDLVDKYEKVYPNLTVHANGYLAPKTLKSLIYWGNVDFDGDFFEDTPGSNKIKQLILDKKPGPLFLASWGGGSTIARALKSIQNQYKNTPNWLAMKAKISKKIILLPSGDQDDSYTNYIQPNWPLIETRVFTEGPNYAFGAQFNANETNKKLLDAEWTHQNIKSKGILGEDYRVWGDGKQMVKDDKFDFFGPSELGLDSLKKFGFVVWMPLQPKGSFISEGDNPTWMNLINNGLQGHQKGYYGGWGGRVVQNNVPVPNLNALVKKDTTKAGMTAVIKQKPKVINQFPDFFEAAQNDFAARLTWSNTSIFKNANHAPVLQVVGKTQYELHAGGQIEIEFAATDPDKNSLIQNWYQLKLPNQEKTLIIKPVSEKKILVKIPDDLIPGHEFHVIGQVTDNGIPQLTRYCRIIITVI